MVARLQRALLLIGLLAVVAWMIRWTTLDRPLLAACAPVFALAVFGLLLGLEFALMAFHNQTPGLENTLPWNSIARAWTGEFREALRVFLWSQPLREQSCPDYLPEDFQTTGQAKPGVLLVHGYFCNRGLWNPWLRRLKAQGTPFVALSLEPVFGSINGYGSVIEAAVRRLESATGMAPVVVAHSMGGLAVRRWWMQAEAGSKGCAAERLHQLITIGTPHHGTWLARFAFSRNAREMRQGSSFLRIMQAIEPSAHRNRTICYYSACDNIVFPPAAAMLDGADNRRLDAVAHVAMIRHEAPFAELQRQLAQFSR
jgi:triacylglycerol lipase